jgi:hypothetical protein
VNSPSGLPFFFITAEVNEKMIEMLEVEIIPCGMADSLSFGHAKRQPGYCRDN